MQWSLVGSHYPPTLILDLLTEIWGLVGKKKIARGKEKKSTWIRNLAKPILCPLPPKWNGLVRLCMDWYPPLSISILITHACIYRKTCPALNLTVSFSFSSPVVSSSPVSKSVFLYCVLLFSLPFIRCISRPSHPLSNRWHFNQSRARRISLKQSITLPPQSIPLTGRRPVSYSPTPARAPCSELTPRLPVWGLIKPIRRMIYSVTCLLKYINTSRHAMLMIYNNDMNTVHSCSEYTLIIVHILGRVVCLDARTWCLPLAYVCLW